jgi:hypothetical protein
MIELRRIVEPESLVPGGARSELEMSVHRGASMIRGASLEAIIKR